MPKRTDIKKILLIGSGPIVIGQACEFDYSGTQACRALKEEGYEVILINSNPATIMTDPDVADRTYIEPLTKEIVAKVIAKEKPQALLPSMGGQTALNIAIDLFDDGTLQKHNVELIGMNVDSIRVSEDRELFKEAMVEAGLDVIDSLYTGSMAESEAYAEKKGYPLIIRPSFTLGGTGGGTVYNHAELKEKVSFGLYASPVSRVLIEEGVIGWKEIEIEIIRDYKNNSIIICSIENFDAMGVHTGESITVAPAQTLNVEEMERIRSASIAALQKLGIKTGGCNIQFALDPESDRMVVIEVNPRVSRSSALASKATGFPIAKIAAKLSVGYSLDELKNDITKTTPASFEPSIDYCVLKFPRWDFDKFPEADRTLNTQMKSVGEVMSIGRSFKETLQKALRSLELDYYGLDYITTKNKEAGDSGKLSRDFIAENLIIPRSERIFFIAEALRTGFTTEEIYEYTKINKWFLDQIEELISTEEKLRKVSFKGLNKDLLLAAKEEGFSDRRIAVLVNTDEEKIRQMRTDADITTTFRSVDTCAGEFEAFTPYYYSSYESFSESTPFTEKSVMILGSGPNRIGQGVEFDYCCVQAAFALRKEGYKVIMVNCNPETVSTDYDISDRLYFEPLTLEDVLNIYDLEKPDGVILQFGGQTPLKLALPLMERGVKIWGTSPADINLAENRREFAALVDKLNLLEPPHGTAIDEKEALDVAKKLGFPVLARPSYVLGGKSMQIVYNEDNLKSYVRETVSISLQNPLLLDKFLEGAVEIDVDAISDGEDVFIGGIMEHVEHAGIHSGDSSCVLPTFSLDEKLLDEIRRQTVLLAKNLNVIGLCNIQFAVRGDKVYLIEANPRASRTVPFVGKSTGLPLAQIAARVMAGNKLKDLNIKEEITPKHIAVKEAVFPFAKFPGVDVILGPEMRSTGEVMGIDKEFGMAFAKSQLAAGISLPLKGKIFLTVSNRDKGDAINIARDFTKLGFSIISTAGTAEALRTEEIEVEEVKKLQEGHPNIIDYIERGEVSLIINTPSGSGSQTDEARMRQKALSKGLSIITTIRAAKAALTGIKMLQKKGIDVLSLQEYQDNLK